MIKHNMTAWINGKIVHEFTLNIIVEPVEFSTGFDTYKPDPAWSYTDPAGHYHATSTEPGHPWPTLDVVRDEHIDPDDNESWVVESHVCSICRVPVEPAMILDKPAKPYVEFVPGRKSWEITVRMINGSAGSISIGDIVSFRALAEGHEVFGLAHVVMIKHSGMSAILEMNLVGVGSLGTRDL